MTTERVNNSPFAWAVQMLPGECCSYGQVHGGMNPSPTNNMNESP